MFPTLGKIQAVWGSEYAANYAAVPGADSYGINEVNHPIVEVLQKYWTGFAKSVGEGVSGNPNFMRAKDSPVWLPFRGDGEGKRLKLQTNATEMEVITNQELELCGFWRRMSA